MKVIQLTQGQSTIVDDEDFEMLSQWKWSLNGRGYARRRLDNGSSLLMHRQIFADVNCQEVDHINGDRLDNRRSNLRPCTISQNKANRGPQKNNTTGYKGVNFSKKKYRASIEVMGEQRFLGRFDTAEEAARAYDKAAKAAFGDFAWLNFPTVGARQNIGGIHGG